MKKSVILFITVLTALSLTAFGFINWNDSETDQLGTSSSEIDNFDNPVLLDINDKVFPVFPDFFYSVGNRFNSIKKEDLDNARSFSDFIGEDHAQRIVSYKSLSVIILEENKQTDIKETSDSGVLTAAQIELLRSSDYSTNLLIWADYREKNKETGVLEDSYWTPYLTIVPETQAVYGNGNDALINYLKENSKEETVKVQEDKLQPGKLYFTITKDGTISNVKVVATSGYPDVDNKLIELISKAPGTWEPAKNSKGEDVDQVLVISFGNMGC